MNNETEQIFILNAASSQPSASAQKPSDVGLPGSSQVNLENVEDFSHVCRTCATITEFVIPIFAGEGLQNNLADKIHKHLPIQVCEGDVLPLVVCYQCTSTLLAWHELVQCCVQADAALRARLNSIEQKTKPTHIKLNSSIEEEAQSKLFYTNVKNALIDFYNDLEEDDLDVEFVCQKCVEKPALTTVHSLAAHIRYDHSPDILDDNGVKTFITNYITFEQVLTAEDSDGETVSDTKEQSQIVLASLHCPFCASVFSSATRLVYHLNKHVEVSIADGFVCCDHVYTNKKHFVLHIQEAHVHSAADDPVHVVCVSCGFTAGDVGELKQHYKDAHDDVRSAKQKKVESPNNQKYIPAVCPECNKTFSNKYNMFVHMRTHSETALFACDRCSKTYRNQGNLNHHKRLAHQGILNFICLECGEAFPSRAERDVHSRIHTGETPFKCEHCGKSYRAKNTLTRHLDIHLDIRKYECEICSKKFRKKSHLDYHVKTHMKTVTPDDAIAVKNVQEDNKNIIKEEIEKPELTISENGKRYAKCGVCQKSVVLGSWPRHARSHRGERRYSCHTCGLAFGDNGNLARHTRALHSKQRPFACPTCSKTFSRKGHLEDHEKSHSDSRGFVCDVCGKRSKSGAALRMHARTHLARRVACVTCGARFKRRAELRAHVSVHTGERAHACVCGRAFRLRTQLTAHARVHHKLPPQEIAPVMDVGTHDTVRFTQYVAQSLEPPQYQDPRASAQRPCTYCTSSHHHTMYKEHLVTAHSDLLFHCEECDKYIDRKDFILHMSLHAVQYTSGQDKTLKRRKVRKRKEEADVNQNASKVPKVMETADTTVQEFNIKDSISQENEFSDHSDIEYGFGPLPESVFEAIEDSQDSQPEDDTSHTPETERSSDESNKSIRPTIDDSNLSNPAPCVETSNISYISKCALPVDSGNTNDPVSPDCDDRNTSNPVPDTTVVSESHRTGEVGNKHRKTRTCPICSKVYTASSSYFYHMKYFHKGSKEHGCEVCGKRFGTKSSLTQHVAIHTGQYEFECKQCQKRFKSKASLYIHEQTHNGKKSWSCNQCQTSFRWKTHLFRHMTRHSAEKVHVCVTCGRGFSIRCDLLRHTRTHTAGNFACDKCGQKFAQLRYLKVHIGKQHSTNTVKESQ